MLEFDGQALDPAIVSAQPMKPVPTVDLQQMGCPSSESLSDVKLFFKRQIFQLLTDVSFSSLLFQIASKVGLSESRLPPTSAVSGPQEPTQVSRVEAHQEVVVLICL